MDRSEAVESFALEKFESIVYEHLNVRDAHIQVWLVREKSFNQRGPHLFKCEVSIRFAPKREVFISKSGQNVYEAIALTGGALSNSLRNEFKRKMHRRSEQLAANY
jgi:ribosome-associated translation inhibitor RaiA